MFLKKMKLGLWNMVLNLFKLVTKVDTGEKDKLGNIIYKKEYSKPYVGRTTEWTADDVELYGREVTSGSRKVLTYDVDREAAKMADSIMLEGGKEYSIESVKDMRRWILFIVKGMRV